MSIINFTTSKGINVIFDTNTKTNYTNQ